MEIDITISLKVKVTYCWVIMLDEKGMERCFVRCECELFGARITGDFCKTQKAAVKALKDEIKNRLAW